MFSAKTNPCFRYFFTCFRYEGETAGKRNLMILEDKIINNHINEKRSLQELYIDVVIHWGIFKDNLITLFPRFDFIPKIGVSFYCV